MGRMGVLKHKTYGDNIGSKNQGRVSILSYLAEMLGILKHTKLICVLVFMRGVAGYKYVLEYLYRQIKLFSYVSFLDLSFYTFFPYTIR